MFAFSTTLSIKLREKFLSDPLKTELPFPAIQVTCEFGKFLSVQALEAL